MNEVHLWYARPEAVEDAETARRWRSLLAPEEQERLDRFRQEWDRRLRLLSAALVRMTLSHYATVPPEGWQFAVNAYGKPRIVGPSAGLDLQFNLTHTAGLAACVVTRGREVGIDADAVSRRVDPSLAQRFFAPEEAAHVDRVAEPLRGEVFLQYWTAKEAYLKALGTGLSTPLDSFSIDLSGDRPRLRPERTPEAAAAWRFFQLRPTPNHWLTIAVSATADEPLTLLSRALDEATR
jgi:4'-phosphopantetheinyl transferase